MGVAAGCGRGAEPAPHWGEAQLPAEAGRQEAERQSDRQAGGEEEAKDDLDMLILGRLVACIQLVCILRVGE